MRGAGVRHGGAALLGLGLGLGLAPACGVAPGPEALELVEFRQADVPAVALNEELLFYFSDELDPASVTSESLRVLDERGEAVPGARVVRGKSLSFLADLPRAADLSDGGLRPGAAYRVVLGGFPRLDGLRAKGSEPLSATLVLSFRTAEPDGAQPLFLDPFRGPQPLLPHGAGGSQRVSQRGVNSTGRIVLVCAEALDPRSITDEAFDLRRYPAAAEPDATLERVPIRARLAVNRRDQAVLVIEPRERTALEPDLYYLSMVGPGPSNLGGRAAEWGWPTAVMPVHVARLELEFARLRERAPERPQGCDGTALWDEDGLGVRYPAAAGSGEAGEIELTRAPDERDLQAARLSVPAGEEVNLTGITGPIVLRSQSSLEVRGALGRRVKALDQTGGALNQELAIWAERPPDQRDLLSAWLARLLASGEPWTVLIAGGDLTVPRGGAIDVSGNLMLVAGGVIRVEGQVVADRVWKTEGGGNVAGRVLNLALPLTLDAPARNALQGPLRVGVLTQPRSMPNDVARWRTVVQRSGRGEVLLDFLDPRREGAPARAASALPEEGERRILVELVVPPGHGEPWDPPRLERLTFEPVLDPTAQVEDR